MAIFNALNTAYSGLNVHQKALDVTSNNISNASNPDYVRERATLTSLGELNSIPGDIGMGVKISSIKRITDTFLFDRFSATNAALKSLKTKEEYLQEISTYFPDIQNEGLNKDLKDFFNSWQNLASNPNDGSAKVTLAQNTQKLTDTFHTLNEKLSNIQKDINKELKANVDEINNILKEIANLNKNISKIEANKISKANELRDKRDALEKRLKELVNVKVFKNQVTSTDAQGESSIDYTKDYKINLGGYSLLDNNTYHQLKIIDNKGNVNIGIEKEDFSVIDITKKIKNSSSTIGALLEVRGDEFDNQGKSINGILGDINSSLDSLAKGIIRSVNSIYSYSAQEEVRGAKSFDPISISDEMRKVPISSLKLAHSVKSGILKLALVDKKGEIASEISVNIKTSDSINEILNKINEKISSYDLKADIINGEIKFVPADTDNDGNTNPKGNILVKDDGSDLFSALNEYEYLPLNLINNQLPLPLNSGSFDVVTYNDNGDELARRTIKVDLDSEDPRYNTISGILNQINLSVDDNNDNDNTNDVDDYYSAKISSGEILFNKKTDKNTYIGLDNDSANFGGVFGINQFFEGDNSSNIELAKKLKEDPSKINAYKAPSEGNNDVANAILDLQSKDIIFYKDNKEIKASIFDYYKITTTNLANETQNTTLKKEANETLFKNISNEYYSLSGVNIDEELINLEKYQRGYQANARVITAINNMLDALFGIKQ